MTNRSVQQSSLSFLLSSLSSFLFLSLRHSPLDFSFPLSFVFHLLLPYVLYVCVFLCVCDLRINICLIINAENM